MRELSDHANQIPAQRSGWDLERTSNETKRMSGFGRTERRGVCEDEEQIEV